MMMKNIHFFLLKRQSFDITFKIFASRLASYKKEMDFDLEFNRKYKLKKK